MPDKLPEPGSQHPPKWRQDLNPNPHAGQNVGAVAAGGPSPRTAFDLKEAHRRLDGFSDQELKQIPILMSGTRLAQGATYLDLADSRRQEFTGMGNMEAGPDNWYVHKDTVDYQLWNRLIGVQNPERLGQADDR